ncbi:MAG TPA: hypothetical protein VM925_28250, partial [Labilithrix sp.]|nr:hypothetical protein [Labilithrix sp.]
MPRGDDQRFPSPDSELDASALESEPPAPAAAAHVAPPPPPSSGRAVGARPVPRATPSRPGDVRPAPKAPLLSHKPSVRPPPPAPHPGLRLPTQPPKPPPISPSIVRGPTAAEPSGSVPSSWHGALDHLLREVDARAAQHPTRAALLLAAGARIYVDATHDPLAAANALGRAAELAPDARFVASARRWLAEQGADPLAVLERTRAELAHVGEGRERTALLWQAAAIEEHAASDVAAAMRTIRELLALEPNDVGALDALGGLLLRSRSNDGRQWDISSASDETVFGGLVEVLDLIAERTDDAVTRSALQGSAGALRDRYLGDIAGALGSLRRALEADPTNAGAQATIEAILLRRRSWDEYARAVEAHAARTTDPGVAREHYERAGEVYAECIGDHTRAAHCFARAEGLDEMDPGPIERLLMVLEASGRWDDAAAAHERLLARLRDPVQKAWALVRLGGLQETRLHRPDDALASYQRAVEASPTFGPAIAALLRVTSARGMPLAIDLEQREADRTVDPAVRAVRYAALAEVVEASSPADLSEDAATLYERTLALDPTNAAAFDALDRMYRAAAQWPRLIALYENALTKTTHPTRARSLRLQLAELLHTRARDPGRAADLRREALAGPDDRYDVLVSLARSLADAGRWPEYVDVLEAQASMLSGADEIAAVFRIGATLETRVKDLQRALTTYEIVIDRAPRHEAAARAIARIHAIEGRWERVIDRERRLLDLAARPEDAVEGLVRIARIFEEQLGRAGEAVHAYLEALERAPSSAPLVAALERLLRGSGDYRRLAQVLQRHADATTDVGLAQRARLRAAALLELCLDDTAAASAAYARVLADAPAAGPLGASSRRVAL